MNYGNYSFSYLFSTSNIEVKVALDPPINFAEKYYVWFEGIPQGVKRLIWIAGLSIVDEDKNSKVSIMTFDDYIRVFDFVKKFGLQINKEIQCYTYHSSRKIINLVDEEWFFENR